MTDYMDEKDNFDEIEPEEYESPSGEPELEDIEENSIAQIKQLKAKLKASEKEKLEHLENLQRAKAEFLNVKRRLEEDRQRDKERAITAQIEKLLPLCDSFFMAQSNEEAWDAIDATWRVGIESIYTQLQDILTSYGVQEINPVGEVFNPELHEALTNVTVEKEGDHDKVVSVIQSGFIREILGKKELIRPARVTVGVFSK